MNSNNYLAWQQWESRVQEWLNDQNDDLVLSDTLPLDRIMLTILTVKYHLLYKKIDRKTSVAEVEKNEEKKASVKLSKTKAASLDEDNAYGSNRRKAFEDLTGRSLSPEQESTNDSAEWQEFNQLCQWHGSSFLRRLDRCLRDFISKMISLTPEYQKLIHAPSLISPVPTINCRVYETKNDDEVFLSVDLKSANSAMLQYIHAVDAQTYPTWSDFLTFFVGSRPLLTQSKILRIHCLGKLHVYRKLNMFWTHFTATIYQTVLCPYLDEIGVHTKCVALGGDEIVFHLDASISEEKARSLMENTQRHLAKESPIVKFHVEVYRLRVFHWQDKHMCFARMFIGRNPGEFDLKAVRDKARNYDQACADFRLFAGL